MRRHTNPAAGGRPGLRAYSRRRRTRWCCSAMLARARNCAKARAIGTAARNRQIAQPIRQLFEGARIAGMRTLRQRAHLLDEREQPVAFKAAERLAEQCAELPHIVAQRLVRVLVHGRVSEGPEVVDLRLVPSISDRLASHAYRGAELAHHPDVGQNVIGDLRHPVVRGAVRKRDKQPRSSTTTARRRGRGMTQLRFHHPIAIATD